jgi:hypothetical protein
MRPRSSLLLDDNGNGSATIACFKSTRSAALSASSRSTVTIYKGTKRRFSCCHFVQGETTALGSRRDRASGAPQLIVRPVIVSETPWPFRLLRDRAEVGHPTIAASVSEMPIPLPVFLGERRCRERTLAKQGGLPNQALPYDRVR